MSVETVQRTKIHWDRKSPGPSDDRMDELDADLRAMDLPIRLEIRVDPDGTTLIITKETEE